MFYICKLGQKMTALDLVCVGLDIRSRREAALVTADASVWDIEDDLIEELKARGDVTENPLQLLHVEGVKKDKIGRIVGKAGADLVSFWITSHVFFALQQLPQYSELSALEWSEVGDFLGFDVCDVNGFFSALHMNVPLLNRTELFSQDEYLNALEHLEVANLLIRDHAPFVLVGLRREPL